MFLKNLKKYITSKSIDFDTIDKIAEKLQLLNFNVDWSNAGVEILFDDLLTVSININKDPPDRVKLDVRYVRGKNKIINIDNYISFVEDLNQLSFKNDENLIDEIVSEIRESYERYIT